MAMWSESQIDRMRDLTGELDHLRRERKQTMDLDRLTGLLNQAALSRRVEDPDGFDGVVVVCDMDNFKDINDRYGHLVGDEILRNIGHLLQSSIRHEDEAFRWGGDEFVILFRNQDRMWRRERMAEIESRLRDFRVRGWAFCRSRSVGGRRSTQGGALRDTLDEADRNMYALKRGAKEMIRTLFLSMLLMSSLGRAAAPVYVVLWFDTEDYIEPSADDAALRIANDLTAAGVRATFKVVGEKARVLEKRGRRDVVAALVPARRSATTPTFTACIPRRPSTCGTSALWKARREFERREAPGVADVKRIFGTQPICYGQPGSSWGPQTNPALRRLGIPVYLDEGQHVGVDEQPFWYGGLLHVFHMGRKFHSGATGVGAQDKAAYQRFDEAARNGWHRTAAA